MNIFSIFVNITNMNIKNFFNNLISPNGDKHYNFSISNNVNAENFNIKENVKVIFPNVCENLEFLKYKYNTLLNNDVIICKFLVKTIGVLLFISMV